jgi:uncharacterized protein YciI
VTFAYILRPPFDRRLLAAASDEVRETFQRHGSYLEELHARGVVRFAGRCENGPFGIVVVETDDESVARQVMEQDPSVAAGVQQPELYEFVVFVERPDG